MSGTPSVALVHDYLNQFGGAERVVLALHRIWPHAALYTSLYRAKSTFPEFGEIDIRTSPLDRVPLDRHFRLLLPFYPAAFRALPVREALVIVSSSGWAHRIRPSPESRTIVYCHTPARWLYQPDVYLRSRVSRTLLAPALAALRRGDRGAAGRADAYVANSRMVRDRIRTVYGRDAEIVPPPVEVDRFRPSPRGERLLVVSRLLDYKRIDLVIDAARRASIGLDVVGVGPALAHLRARAGPGTTFHGRLPDAAVKGLLEGCRALCLPGTEDFGIVAVEAHAAGKPVIAFAAGGALEIVEDGRTGALFSSPDVRAVIDAIRRADGISTSPEEIGRRAQRFSTPAFMRRFAGVVGRLDP